MNKKPIKIGRRHTMERAFKTIAALKNKNGVTARELGQILDFDASTDKISRDCARRWIDVASIHYPVAEIGRRRSAGVATGALSTVYRLMGD